MDQKLAQLSTLNQKDKGTAYLSLLSRIFTSQGGNNIARDLHVLVDHLINQDAGIIAGRQVLTELVKSLTSATIPDRELRKAIVEDILSIIQLRATSYEEQVNLLKFELADILENEEDWSAAARVLRGINLEASQRSDEEKLRVYIRVVRLLLEEEDSVQAETYYNRATSLIHSTADRETLLTYKLCQARISDYARKFLEAASRYHELSFIGEIDEDERKYMLSAAVTCAVLAPAGPNRSRILSSLFRDERTAELPTYNILSKMFLDHILRPIEVKEFEKTLKTHQLAKIALSTNDRLSSTLEDGDFVEGASTRTGPTTVLDRAVMEHNVLASSRIYNNITFGGLGALLDLTPGAAETMARKMIEQGRLKGHIDQVNKLIWFEAGREEDDAQGKAGGLGDVNQDSEDTGSLFTKRWDKQIRMTAAHVETLVQHLTENGLVRTAAIEV
jgi:COP9 signalosome complex subunit 4